jgi:uncharacterized protein YndB with AHSA1/START domain
MPDAAVKTVNAGVDIARDPHYVFGYITDAAHLPDWQPDVRRAEFDDPSALGVGTRGHEVRHVMGADRTITCEVTEYEPDRRYGVRGLDGPVRAQVTMGLTTAADGTGTHLEYSIGFEGHGIGTLIAVLARNGARKEAPATLERLKRQLEGDR